MSKTDITLKYKTPGGFDFSDSFSSAPNGQSTSYSITRDDDGDDFTFNELVVETAAPDSRTLSRSFAQGASGSELPAENGVTVDGIDVNSSNVQFRVKNFTQDSSDLTISIRVKVNDKTTKTVEESEDPQITVKAGGGT